MTTQTRPCSTKNTIAKQTRLAIAERQLARRKGCHEIEQAKHVVPRPLSIDKRATQKPYSHRTRHARPRSGEAANPSQKIIGLREVAGMKLWIAPRKPANIASLVRRFIGQRRKECEFRASRAPTVENMRIKK